MEQSFTTVELDRHQLHVLENAVAGSQRAIRRSIGRALAFVMPGLGHAFHGAYIWAIGYLVAFMFAIWRSWANVMAWTNPYYQSTDGTPRHLVWLAIAVAVWVVQLIHVDRMNIND